MAHQSGYLSFIFADDLPSLRLGLVDFDIEYEVRQLPVPRMGQTVRKHLNDQGAWFFASNFLLPIAVAFGDIRAGLALTIEVFTNNNNSFILAGRTERWRVTSPIDAPVRIAMLLRGDALLTYEGGHLLPDIL